MTQPCSPAPILVLIRRFSLPRGWPLTLSALMALNVGFDYRHHYIPLQVSDFRVNLYYLGAGHPGEDDIGGLVLVGRCSA